MKYLIIEVGAEKREMPLLFSEDLFHRDFTDVIKNKVVSAGFVTRGRGNRLECYGRSVGLDICSRTIDAEIINDALTPFDWQKVVNKAGCTGVTGQR